CLEIVHPATLSIQVARFVRDYPGNSRPVRQVDQCTGERLLLPRYVVTLHLDREAISEHFPPAGESLAGGFDAPGTNQPGDLPARRTREEVEPLTPLHHLSLTQSGSPPLPLQPRARDEVSEIPIASLVSRQKRQRPPRHLHLRPRDRPHTPRF